VHFASISGLLAVDRRFDKLGVRDLKIEAVDEKLGDVLASRTHFAGHSNYGHCRSPFKQGQTTHAPYLMNFLKAATHSAAAVKQDVEATAPNPSRYAYTYGSLGRDR
jgi:hypothetical protein